MCAKFSKAWKFPRKIFQALEKFLLLRRRRDAARATVEGGVSCLRRLCAQSFYG